jgi:hypothetical protein
MMKLSPRLIIAYHRQIDRLRAAELLDLLSVGCAPHREPAARKELYDELVRRVRAEPERTINTAEELAQFLAEI